MQPDDSIRDALEAGQPVVIDPALPRESRILPLRWLERGLASTGSLDVSGAIFDSKLILRNLSVANKFRLNNCLFEDGLTLEYCNFTNIFTLTESEMLNTVVINASRFSSDFSLQHMRLRGSKDTLALGIFDCTFDGVVEAQRLRVHSGRMVRFERVTFRSDIYLAQSWLTGDLLLSGTEIGRGLDLTSAVVGGNLHLAETYINGAFALGGIRLKGTLDGFALSAGRVSGRKARLRGQLKLNYSAIKGLVNLEQAYLDRGATFEATRMDGGLFLRDARFGDELVLSDSTVDGGIRLQNAVFANSTPSISAIRLTVRGEVNLMAVKARGYVNFTEARLGSVDFRAGQFSATVNFYSASMRTVVCTDARLRGSGESFNLSGATLTGQLFMDGARFRGECNFVGLRVEQQISATNCVFLGGLDFYEGYVGRGAFFWYTSHNQQARFSGVTVIGELYLSGSRFRNDFTADQSQLGACRIVPAGKTATVESRRYLRGETTRFEKDFNFRNVRISGRTEIMDGIFGGALRFDNSVFSGEFTAKSDDTHPLDLDHAREVSFRGCRFQDAINLRLEAHRTPVSFEFARFARELIIGGLFIELSLKSASAESVVRLRGTILGDLDLSNTKAIDVDLSELRVENGVRLTRAVVKQLVLPDDGSQLRYVDANGCNYDRIRGDWMALVARPPTDAVHERQPYTHLEQVLRRQGDDKSADNAYLIGRKMERVQYWRRWQFWRWFKDAAYGVSFRYGVHSWRATVFVALSLGLGTYFFSLPHAIKQRMGPSPTVITQKQPSFFDALGVSTNQILPIQTALAGDWVPTDEPVSVDPSLPAIRSDVIAVIMKIVGLILIPLIIASVSGLLRRSPRS